MLHAGPNQFNVVPPAAIAGRSKVQITVTGPQGSTAFPTVFVADARPQISSIAINPDGTINSVRNPAKGALTLWATGMGLESGQRPDGSVTPPYQTLAITATSNGTLEKPIQVTYAGDAPGAVFGLTQINIQISATEVIAIHFQGVTSPFAAFYATAP